MVPFLTLETRRQLHVVRTQDDAGNSGLPLRRSPLRTEFEHPTDHVSALTTCLGRCCVSAVRSRSLSTQVIAGDAAGNYTVVRTFIATDDCGNSTSATQTITVEDTTAPEFTSIPADYTSECSDDLILDDASATDNCGEVTIEVSSETIAGDAAGNYTVVRTFTATDDAGNSTFDSDDHCSGHDCP